MNKQQLYELTQDDWDIFIKTNNFPAYRSKQIITSLYTNFEDISNNTTLPKEIKENIENNFEKSLKVLETQKSIDGTIKILFETTDLSKSIEQIETVIMNYTHDDKINRSTVCISSQAGCAMGCVFCATGQNGFNRHLSKAEIIEQVMNAIKINKEINDCSITNIVFMGMGEPLANADIVYESIKTIHDLIGISARKITVSTVGFIPGMKKMLNWELPVTLAVSLHAPNNDARSEIVPMNKKYSIEDILDIAQEYSALHGRRVTFEYVGLEANISNEYAHELGQLLQNYDGKGGAHLNLIPYNQTSFMQNDVPIKKMQKFCEIVQKYGVTTTLRINRGNDIDAACGQLKERNNNS